MIPFVQNVQKSLIYRDRKMSGFLGLGWEQEMSTDGHKGS